MRTEIHDRLDALVGLRTQWQALESRALERDACLSARFVLPSLALLPASPPVWAVSVHDGATAAGTLRGLGLFQARAPRPLFPFPHVQPCTSPHSFLGRLLPDAEAAHPALHALLDAVVAERGASWREELWPDRVPLHSGSIAFGRQSRAAARAAKALSLACRRLMARWRNSWNPQAC